MTTPPADEPAAGPSAASESTGPSAETAPQPAAAPAGPPPPSPPGAEYAGFAPVPRPPRVPWVNPARRTQLVGWAMVASVLLIGAGFGIGYGVAGSDDDHHRPAHMYHRDLLYDMRGHQGGALQPRRHYVPPQPPVSTTTVTVTPSPTSTS